MNRSNGESLYVCPLPWLTGEYEEWREASIVIMRGLLWEQVDKPGPWWTLLINSCEFLDDKIAEMESSILWYIPAPEETKQRLLEHVEKIRAACRETLEVMRRPISEKGG